MKRSLMMVVLLVAFAAVAQGEVGKVKDGKVVKSARDEIARLQRELDQQRALLVRMIELQQQQYAVLLKLAKGEVSAGEVAPVEPSRAAAPPVAEPDPVASSAAASARPTKAHAGRASSPTGAVSGKVTFTRGSAPAWVFVEDLKGSASGEFEIKQEDKQFVPRFAAVPRGTKLKFANYDNIFHNVFSVSAGNSFDVGNSRSGEPPRSYVAQAPGVIDIFCNIHSKMSASVLVAPGVYLAKVQSDGTFRLDDVPVGQRKIGAWAGGQKIVLKDVNVTTAGAEVAFELQVVEAGSHKNKSGQSYGSYAD
ncbi:MAG: hypothetical protein K1X64_04435 [Myxococcaceae bacterium]|nr:hypothetical protein [Myxococcaceae bacterium]